MNKVDTTLSHQQWLSDYDDLSSDQKEHWSVIKYIEHRQIIERYFNTYEKASHLIAQLSILVEMYPKYNVILEMIDYYIKPTANVLQNRTESMLFDIAFKLKVTDFEKAESCV